MQLRTAICLVSYVVSAPLVAADKTPDAEGFVTIFDGASLEGWKKATENPDSIQLKEGAIVANGPRCHLYYVGDEQPFKNFDFKCEVMTKPNSNGGIYFHTKYQGTNWPAQGHECQVNNTFKADPQKTGGVYKVAKVLEAPANDNEWFKYEIIVQGNHVVTKINDKVAADYTEDAEALAKDRSIEPGRRISEGTFALQAHDPGSTVMYRNIKVKRLP
jgi:3-keto-disaccharide hydrolase